MRLCKNRFQDYEGEDEFRETLLDEYKAAQEDVDFVATLIIATSETSSYEDVSLFVFLGTDGKLYEVHGSHCSCYGFEEQWQPEETTFEALAARRCISKHWLGENASILSLISAELSN
jgi:hypothetical protein